MNRSRATLSATFPQPQPDGALPITIPAQPDSLRDRPQSFTLCGVDRKRDAILDRDAVFERTSGHLQKCWKCRNARMERARRENLGRRGRQLLEDLERVGRVYYGTKLVA